MGISVKKFRFFLWLSLAIVFVWILWLAVVPGGRISYTYDFRKENYFIRRLTPDDRVEEPKNGEQKITGNPVYFALRTSRTFDRAKVTVSYKNPDKLPLIELGVLADNKVWRYQIMPLQNTALDDLLTKWPSVRDGNLILLQRATKFADTESFLAHLPSKNEVALYNHQLSQDYYPDDYKPSTATTTIKIPIRGTYQFYTYIGKEPLDYKFSFIDLNQNKDADSVILKLYRDKAVVLEKFLPDDGIKGDAGIRSASRILNLDKSGLKTGLYKIEIVANDDIITDTIETGQSKISFINRLWLADENQGSVNILTDSLKINAQTINPASLQTIYVGAHSLELTETYRQFTFDNSSGLVELSIKKGDLIISGDGLFAFASTSYFNPDWKKFSYRLDLDKQGINYVLANYQSPVQADGWQTASAEFDLRNAYREFSKYNFIISVPDLSAEDELNDGLVMNEIRVDLTGTNLWQKLKKTISGD